jgi:Lrp/AsnC family transcriptional regulator
VDQTFHYFRNFEMKHQIDLVDRSILRALQADGSLSMQLLAEKVGASAVSCWRRVKALEAAGILTRTVRLVDQAKIGLSVTVICNLRMRAHTAEVRAAFERFVHAHPEILTCFSISGEWDYILRIAAVDVAAYEQFLMRKLLAHDAVLTASSQFALSTIKNDTALPVT